MQVRFTACTLLAFSRLYTFRQRRAWWKAERPDQNLLTLISIAASPGHASYIGSRLKASKRKRRKGSFHWEQKVMNQSQSKNNCGLLGFKPVGAFVLDQTVLSWQLLGFVFKTKKKCNDDIYSIYKSQRWLLEKKRKHRKCSILIWEKWGCME